MNAGTLAVVLMLAVPLLWLLGFAVFRLALAMFDLWRRARRRRR